MATPSLSFHIREILGTGSYGTVVVAQPEGEDRQVVIKVLQPALLDHPEVLARTRDEARLLAKLDHPNVVAMEALHHHQGRPVLIMEHVDGADMGTLLRAHPKGLGASVALFAVAQVASALALAWSSLKVVHRDIKPSNILLATDGRVKVVDFGLAYAEFEEREAQSLYLVVGSLGFMAPERMRPGAMHPAVDVYALGITLVQLLTGRNLLLPRGEDRHDPELVRQLQHVSLPDEPAAKTDALRSMIARMCAFDPDARPPPEEVHATILQQLGPFDAGERASQAEALVAASRKAPSGPVEEHPDWPDVAFLQTADEEPAKGVLHTLGRWMGLGRDSK
ncbi:MAG: serine/threonine protein kinase [Myxococcales bacterium]|nr:serine/threonine protein kinase [Myxococcales bacterium]